MVARSGKFFPGNRAAAIEFQPAGRETEDYAVEPSNVTLLELTVDPDKESKKARGFTSESAPSLTSRRSLRPNL
jgi:hypothetical protein